MIVEVLFLCRWLLSLGYVFILLSSSLYLSEFRQISASLFLYQFYNITVLIFLQFICYYFCCSFYKISTFIVLLPLIFDLLLLLSNSNLWNIILSLLLSCYLPVIIVNILHEIIRLNHSQSADKFSSNYMYITSYLGMCIYMTRLFSHNVV